MRKRIVCILVACVALVALVVLLWPRENASPLVDAVSSPREIRKDHLFPARGEDTASTEEEDVSDEEEAQSEDEPETPEEKAQAAYEEAFDAFVAQQEKEGWKPTPADIVRYKKLFDTLTDEQKLEEIPHAQNLFEDSAFGFLKAVLMDPKEPQDVLESIYYDLLNRPEELKYSVLREVYGVKDHPLRKEIEELDEMLGD